MNICTINSIETSSKCNLSCQYCMAKDQDRWRNTGIMSIETFRNALTWIKYFSDKGTQRELNLFGIGEPLLNPNIVEMVKLARRIVPLKHRVHLNTNSVYLTEELAYALSAAGITSIDLTAHDAFHTAKAVRILQKVGIPGGISLDFITQPNDWAGQVNWFKSAVRYPCPWLHVGQAVVLSNGDIVQCCFDAKAANVIGNVVDGPSEIIAAPFNLCKDCHQDIPREV